MPQNETKKPASHPDESQKQARRAAIVWPGIIIGLLVSQVVLLLSMAYIATSDQSFAVEPDYYQKALNWDQLAAQNRLNDKLGWSAHIQVSDAADLMKRRDVTCTLSSDSGQPLSGANVELIAFPHARAGERLRSTMTEQEAGNYTTNLPIARTGLWEFRITAKRESSRFTRVIQQEIKPPGATARWRR